MDSYYAMLNVSKTSTDFAADAKKQYRKLSLRMHPDKGGNEADFQKLNRAYEVLKDDEKRAAYDRFGLDLGDDTSADDLAAELGNATNKYMGMAGVRTALCGAAVVFLRWRWLRTLIIAGCGGAVLLGKHQRKAELEQAGFRLLALPVAAWVLHAVSLGWCYDAALYAAALGALELEGAKTKGGLAALALALRWWLGARFVTFLKLLGVELALLILAHFFFVLVSAVVKELVDQKLKSYGESFRKLMAEEGKKLR
mmetsp:Transcript_17595/g.52362  ORF Transcript_17595/g.52362 Transcript_17595/m.52362 type:complete len:255 (-) Transcript_17595:22-786(-)